MSLKGNKCADCGVKVGEIPDSCFHFHHDKSVKNMSISAHRGKKEDIINEAINYTVLLCSCCHASRHDGNIYKCKKSS
jgi:hypothetical protein